MKIKNILTASLAGAVLVAGAASATMADATYYVGGDVTYGKWSYGDDFKNASDASGTKLKKGNNSFGLVLGGKFHENFGAELGYTRLGKTKSVDVAGANERSVKARNMHLDAVGYAPVADKVNLLGTLGLGKMKTKRTDANANSAKESKTGLRIGFGAEYRATDVLGVRVMARHQNAGSSSKHVKSLKTLGAGVTWDFM